MSEKEKEINKKAKEDAERSLFLTIIYLSFFIAIFEITKNIYVFLIIPIVNLLIDILDVLREIRRRIEEMKNERK
jgi:O-antigen/teichoic acid export membrane protein